MSEKPLFTLPGPMTAETPFTEFHAWQWAQHQKRDRVDVFNYLAELGFVKGKHRITPEQFELLRVVIDMFHRVAPRMDGIHAFADLLTPATSIDEQTSFYVQGKPGRYVPSDALVAALVDAGWVYAVRPQTTYFAIINGKVFAKYQQIIGSRVLAQLKDE